MISFRTVLAACPIENERIVRAVGALRTEEEDVLEGDIAKEGSANVKVEDKLAS